MINYFQNNKILSCFLIIAIIGDFAIPYFLATFYKGYSHNLMVMSLLGNPNSPVRIFYNTWLIILGILLIFSSSIVFSKYSLISKPLTIATVVLILIFAIGAGILSGIFSVNQSKEIITVESQIHGVGAVLGFMSMLFVPLFLAILSYKNNSNFEGMLFTICFIFAFVFFVFFIMADKPQFQSTFIKNEGLWQRLSLLSMYFPLGYIAVENLIYFIQIK
jgi:hypothetical membrane protein